MDFHDSAGASSPNAENSSFSCSYDELPSPYGCISHSTEDTVFISTNKLFWVNSGAQLIIILVGLIDFFLANLYFFIRRRRNEERLERSRASRQSLRVNEDEHMGDSPSTGFSRSQALHRRLKSVSELNGRCCGCGRIADTVLLPCKHAVCCYSCSDHATHCPFCKEACEDRQRLFAV
ncbi:hypothetical protein Q4I28_006496 [Leishmania naiffi]|uniref:RING-type domain-containing protein n=1 Tax=Leishmania naiffi TaxID=5678 RepID=A0AAW3B991_9TRYP